MKGLAYICQRCSDVVGEPHDDPEVQLRRNVEAGHLHTFHKCAHDGGTGICRLVGTASEQATLRTSLLRGGPPPLVTS
jgi:hypothetical protein